MTKVFRDAAGAVINIGEWDEQIVEVDRNPVPDDVLPTAQDSVLVWLGPDDKVIHTGEWQHDYQKVAQNPVPAGVTISDEEVVTGWDGGRYAATDPRRLGPA